MIQSFNVEIETIIDVKKFPFDYQVLAITFAPFYLQDVKLKFLIDEKLQGIAKNAHLSEWEILYFVGIVIIISKFFG